jgi:hypothetical protein
VSIVEFLQARYAEIETAALAASPGPWHLNAEHDEVIAVDDVEVCTAFALSSNQTRRTAEHIALHDPAYELKVIEANRAILAPYLKDAELYRQDGLEFTAEHPQHRVVRILAAVFADHPDYRTEWTP